MSICAHYCVPARECCSEFSIWKRTHHQLAASEEIGLAVHFQSIYTARKLSDYCGVLLGYKYTNTQQAMCRTDGSVCAICMLSLYSTKCDPEYETRLTMNINGEGIWLIKLRTTGYQKRDWLQIWNKTDWELNIIMPAPLRSPSWRLIERWK